MSKRKILKCITKQKSCLMNPITFRELKKLPFNRKYSSKINYFQDFKHWSLNIRCLTKIRGYHVKNILILQSLLKRWRHEVIIIKEINYLNTLSLEELFISLQSHEIELNQCKPERKPKSIDINSKARKVMRKALQVEESRSIVL